MSGRPTDQWKADSKCRKCMEINPSAGKKSAETLQAEKDMAEFTKLVCQGKKGDMKRCKELKHKIITLTR